MAVTTTKATKTTTMTTMRDKSDEAQTGEGEGKENGAAQSRLSSKKSIWKC